MKSSRFFALAAVLVLTACGGTKLYNTHLDGSYRFSDLMASHGGKDMKLEVINAPTGPGTENLIPRMANEMSGKNIGPPITFTETPELSVGASTRMVAAFNPPLGTLPRHVCGGELSGTGAVSEGSIILAYCRGDEPLSSTWIEIPQQDGQYVLTGAFDSVLRIMMPRLDPGSRNEGTCTINCS